jgi:hypothetical protein
MEMFMKVIYRNILLILFFTTLSTSLKAQQKDYLAIISPFYDRLYNPSNEYPIQLKKQRFALFVYKNAVAVYSEAVFVNTWSDEMSQEFSLPSTGFDENGDLPGGHISNGILSVHMWIEDERIEPKIINEGNEEWYTIKTSFEPGQTHKINALFWAQTSLTDIDSLPGLDSSVIKDGPRGFLVKLDHASIWKDYIESLDVVVVLRENIAQNLDSLDIQPKTYDFEDSTLTWNYTDIEPTPDDNITVFYQAAGQEKSKINTMAKLSEFIVQDVYKELVSYYQELFED